MRPARSQRRPKSVKSPGAERPHPLGRTYSNGARCPRWEPRESKRLARAGAVADGLLDQTPLAPLVLLHANAGADRERMQLSFQLAVAGQPVRLQFALLDGPANRAAGLTLVTAVAKAAAGGEPGDVVEGLLQRAAVSPELELAQPGRVDQHPAVGQDRQLAVGSRMASLAVAPHGLGLEDGISHEPVDQG